MFAAFDRFELEMTRTQAARASHPGPCDASVAALVADPTIARQLDKIGPEVIRHELRGYGAWDTEELQDDQQNRHRLVWVAACNITEES